MSWFNTVSFVGFAKSALSSAQKKIDKALDIQEESEGSHRKTTDSAKQDSWSFQEQPKTNLLAVGQNTQPKKLEDLQTETTMLDPLEELKYNETYDKENSKFWSDWGLFFDSKETPGSFESIENLTAGSTAKYIGDTVVQQPQTSQVLQKKEDNMSALALFTTENKDTNDQVKFDSEVANSLSIYSDKSENFMNQNNDQKNVGFSSKKVLEIDSIMFNIEKVAQKEDHFQTKLYEPQGTSTECIVDRGEYLHKESKDRENVEETLYYCSQRTDDTSQKKDFKNFEFQNAEISRKDRILICDEEFDPLHKQFELPVTQNDSSDSETLTGSDLMAHSTEEKSLETFNLEDFEEKKLESITDMLHNNTSPKNRIKENISDTETDWQHNRKHIFFVENKEFVVSDNMSTEDEMFHQEMAQEDVKTILEQEQTDFQHQHLASSCNPNTLEEKQLECKQKLTEEEANVQKSNEIVSKKDRLCDSQTNTESSLSNKTVISTMQHDRSLDIPLFTELPVSSCDSQALSRDQENTPMEINIQNSSDEWEEKQNMETSQSEYFGELCQCFSVEKQEIRVSSEEDEPRDAKDWEARSSDSVGSHETSSSSSFVKCVMDDIDNTSSLPSTQGNSGSLSERSELQKLDFNSGHTSGDEVETTTSSDIEIISPNGDNGEYHRLSPLKHMWTLRPNNKSRSSESPSSDTGREGIMPAVQETEEESDLDGENIRKTPDSNTVAMDSMLKRMTEIEEVLNQREKKILELSRENIKLQESNSSLLNELSQVKEAYSNESRGVSGLTQEFTQRLADLDTKLQNATKERDKLFQDLETAKSEAASRLSVKETEKILQDKDQQIRELLQEGEKLSKQQLQQSNIIKKLRVKEKENDGIIKSQKETLEGQTKELDRLRKSLSAKDEQEKIHIEIIRQLKSTVQKQETEVSTLKSDLEDAHEKVVSLNKALQASSKELAELLRANAEKDSKVQEALLSAEIAAKEELRQTLEHVKQEYSRERETLQFQLLETRSMTSQLEQESQHQVGTLQTEIAELRYRLQEADQRTEDANQNISSATRPLLRQVENLQSTLRMQAMSFERLEKNLNEKLIESQKELMLAKESEKTAKETCKELKSKTNSLLSENLLLKQEVYTLTKQVEDNSKKLANIELEKEKSVSSNAYLKNTLEKKLSDLQKEKENLEAQTVLLQQQLDTEKRQAEVLKDQMKCSSGAVSRTSSRHSTSPSSHHLSFSNSLNQWEPDLVEPSEHFGWGSYSSSTAFNHFSKTSDATFLENLQSQLKQKESQLGLLQSQIEHLEQVKESMTQELVNLNEKIDHQDSELCVLKDLQSEFQDMEQKYNTLLQMYGEKVEEAEELKLDLEDVKLAFRNQLDALTREN
ncbi:TATA element modulatory factor-like [Limulus polyphemus]|uniref:TATA element modulatory factor-like n=1 Tax=Limulus polyphemus TaxID=6850 RepID=A0ABM1B8Q0_LIMPO|nr:TATA element modulatory factor-like [Limulus polyphemus]XP_013777081.1 TATA element modulatory factor-like [Limulus polyphemus]XP_022244521.1 TATA element modulatory factor-like [Limulus polyphemus]XP_022244522.1 TATA element modulatory factor-like [Limulus polyphemus]XP_022244523.1 TATA element modulatory factor-like [Limulus polyphemus]XP_022244524.1 TATA element modulatory factor-like [Limulus polyphemus]XP_022244525.1 TATA element modulatory factor-like [Limulus polyphemus]XP_02224452